MQSTFDMLAAPFYDYTHIEHLKPGQYATSGPVSPTLAASQNIMQKLGFTAPRTGSSGVIYANAGAPPAHNRMRLAANPGAPKLRAPGSSYPKTNFKRPLLASVRGASDLPLRVLRAPVPVPDNFCWQPQDLTSTLDQGNCGSCWAHATVSILGDRVSIQTNGEVRTALDVQQVMECADYPQGCPPTGCEGNDPYTALKGLVSKATKLNASGEYPRKYTGVPSSQSSCASATADKYNVTASEAFMISEPVRTPGDEANKRNVENMKNHIYFEGPIIGTFQVYRDFMGYDGKTIYEPSQEELANGPEGAHAIEIIGWGTDPTSGTGYWVARNSWGSTWPSSHKQCAGTGTFYMKMGSNTCEFEAYCAGAKPSVANPEKAPKDKGGMYPGEKACTDNDWHNMKTISNTGPNLLTVGFVLVGAALVIGAGYLGYRRMKATRRI